MPRIPLEERRERLMTAAFELIAEEGTAAVTTRKVAARAEMPLASFHYVFASRDELLAAMLGKVMEDNLAFVLNTSVTVGSLEESLSDFFDGMVHRIETTVAFQRAAMELVMWSIDGNNGSEMMVPYQMAGVEMIGGVFARLGEAVGVRWTVPVDVLALQSYVLWDGLCLRFLQSRSAESLHLLRQGFVASFTALAEPIEPKSLA